MIRKHRSMEAEGVELEILDLLQDPSGNINYIVKVTHDETPKDWWHEMVSDPELEHYWRPVK